MRVARTLTLLIFSLAAMSAQARQPVFVSLYGGGTTFDPSFQFSQPINIDQEDDGDVIGLGLGYEITDNWIIKLDYTYTDADDITVDQIFLSLNYKQPMLFDGFHGIIGAVVGEGMLDLDDAPDFADSVFDDLDADQSLYGVQIGFEYDISEHWSTSLLYQYFDQEFKTHIDTTEFGRANFFHEEFQYVLFALNYHF